jgi:hypothetical protein
VLLVASISCKKEENKSVNTLPTSSGYFINITVNGVPYSEDIGDWSSEVNNRTGCDAYTYSHAYIQGFDLSTFSFVSYITHRQNKADFNALILGSYNVKDYQPYSSLADTLCNWDLAIYYYDRTLSSYVTTVEPNGVHNVTAITYVSETSSYVKYDIEGNFDFSVKNSANAIIHITGAYKKYIETLK